MLPESAASAPDSGLSTGLVFLPGKPVVTPGGFRCVARRGTLVPVMTIVGGVVAGAAAGSAVYASAARSAGRVPAAGMCEIACAVIGAVATSAGTPLAVLAFAVLGWWSVGLATVDILVRRLPNVLTLGGGVAVLSVASITGHGSAALAGAALMTAPMLVVHLVSPRSLGAGDVKLAVALGGAAAVAGARAWLVAALLPSVLTVLAAAVLGVVHRRVPRPDPAPPGVPHGPSMCAAAMLGLCLES
ncbi:prepilin peptidase [Rhodococcus coprophilus]|uniref:Prepilin peptidase n=2 Tax=Rhodococcus coprophilus TaxID=38310 RepID=A0A2X4TMZ5_9NOCA|nr:prepilin peptidase [Rhodococcus coprophilus]